LVAGAITATSVTFTFTSPLDNGGLAISSYKIYYDNGAGQTGTSIVYAYLAAVTVASPTLSNAATISTYTASGLTTATAYNFKVAAVNSLGVGPRSAGDFRMVTS
jgi:titin